MEAQVDSSTFPPAGGTGILRITTNRECAWAARSEAAWVSVSTPASGQGDGSLAFSVGANGDPSKRNGAISVNDRRVDVSQDGRPCAFDVAPTRQQVEASGGNHSVQVTASSSQCGWTAASDQLWISISAGERGTGNGAVTFHVDAVSGPSRTGTLTVAGQVVQVEQGMGCTYSVGGSVLTVGSSGGFVEFGVSAPAGCAWTVENQTAWLTIVSPPSGSGGGQVRLAVQPNSGPAREGSVMVAGRSLLIAQASGCSYGISTSSGQNAPGTGGTGNVSIATAPGCPWTATSNAEWLNVSPASSSGSSTVQFTVAPNPSIARVATLTVAGHSVTINQASPCTFSLAPPFLTYDSSGGNGAVLVIVTGECTWLARSSVDWIRMVSGTSGAGNGLVQFTVDANPGANRSAVVVIAGQDVAVTQAGR